jgi:hypothetical protein
VLYAEWSNLPSHALPHYARLPNGDLVVYLLTNLDNVYCRVIDFAYSYNNSHVCFDGD